MHQNYWWPNNEIGHTTVSVQLLEEQVRLNTARVEAIKNQAEKFELSIQFLEPSSFEGLAAEAIVWRKFLEDQAGPSPWEGPVNFV